MNLLQSWVFNHPSPRIMTVMAVLDTFGKGPKECLHKHSQMLCYRSKPYLCILVQAIGVINHIHNTSMQL